MRGIDVSRGNTVGKREGENQKNSGRGRARRRSARQYAAGCRCVKSRRASAPGSIVERYAVPEMRSDAQLHEEDFLGNTERDARGQPQRTLRAAVETTGDSSSILLFSIHVQKRSFIVDRDVAGGGRVRAHDRFGARRWDRRRAARRTTSDRSAADGRGARLKSAARSARASGGSSRSRRGRWTRDTSGTSTSVSSTAATPGRSIALRPGEQRRQLSRSYSRFIDERAPAARSPRNCWRSRSASCPTTTITSSTPASRKVRTMRVRNVWPSPAGSVALARPIRDDRPAASTIAGITHAML